MMKFGVRLSKGCALSLMKSSLLFFVLFFEAHDIIY